MKRRTFKQLRPKRQPHDHHHVYVVLLDPAVEKIRTVRLANSNRDSKKPCVYVGMTGLSPEERFANHKAGLKAASVVKRYGIALMPELYEHLNPMPFGENGSGLGGGPAPGRLCRNGRALKHRVNGIQQRL